MDSRYPYKNPALPINQLFTIYRHRFNWQIICFTLMRCHKCLQAASAACKCPDKSVKLFYALSQHTAVQLGDLGFAAEGHGGVQLFLQDL